jgi:hypothetical protein
VHANWWSANFLGTKLLAGGCSVGLNMG